MQDIARQTPLPVQATDIVKKCVLLLVIHVLWKKWKKKNKWKREKKMKKKKKKKWRKKNEKRHTPEERAGNRNFRLRAPEGNNPPTGNVISGENVKKGEKPHHVSFGHFR